MWLIVLIVLFAIIITIVVISSDEKSPKPKNESSPVRPNTTTTYKQIPPIYKPHRIEDCISTDDRQYQISYETQRIIDSIEESKTTIKNAITVANATVSTAWLNSYARIIKISNNLDENLKYYSQKKLEISKFQYYTSLHFRSMIAADIAYKEYRNIDDSYNEINKLIVNMAQTKKNIGISKTQVYAAKDAMKELRKTFLNRVHELNHQTELLRDKIGQECGERGRKWREDRMRNHL